MCRHILVSGKVQGVFYRDSTLQQALNLGLTGYVQNLPDGQVEIEVCGEQPSLEELLRWLWKGPIMAVVEDVQIQDITVVKYTSFDIL